MLGDTGNKWAVCILLECILVILFHSVSYRYIFPVYVSENLTVPCVLVHVDKETLTQ